MDSKSKFFGRYLIVPETNKDYKAPWRISMQLILRTAFLVVFLFPNIIAAQKVEDEPTNELTGLEVEAEVENVTQIVLTGDPQKDYIHDPNLPHEVKGYDLSDYPFYKRVPDLTTSNFTCKGRHDGFYASVPHKCQVYFNCLFEIRYDFLCANYTVFDQKNFICHYVSEVDCENSEKYFFRNDELYETTTTTTQAPQIIYVDRFPNQNKNRPRPKFKLSGKHAPSKNRRKPTPAPQQFYEEVYDDYYDYDYDYYDDYYYDEPSTTTTTTTPAPKRKRVRRPRPGPGGRFAGQNGNPRLRQQNGVFSTRGRNRPRINPPVPSNVNARTSRIQEEESQSQNLPIRRRPNRPGGRRKQQTTTSTSTTTTTQAPDYYYYDYYDYDNNNTNNKQDRTSTTTTPEPTTTTSTSAPDLQSQGTRRRQRRPSIRGRPNIQQPTPTTSETNLESEAEIENPNNRVFNRRLQITNIQNRNSIVRKSGRPVDNKDLRITEKENLIIEDDQTTDNSTPQRSIRNQNSFPEIVVEEPPLAPGIDIDAITSTSNVLPRRVPNRRRFQRPEEPIIRDRRPLIRSRPRVVNADY